MEENIYAELEKNISDMVNDTAQTGTLALGTYLPKIEESFEKIGFRDESESGEVKNILLLKLDNVGDFILLSAAIREFRKNFPSANITLVVSRNIFPVAERCPYVNEILPFDMPGIITNVVDVLKIIAIFCKNYLWKRRFDLAVDFRYFKYLKEIHLFTSYFSGARARVGYNLNMEEIQIPPR